MTAALALHTDDENLIDWSDQLSVGIQEIDEQHKVLVDLLNKLHAAIINHQGHAVALSILDQLFQYTHVHFTVEESLMRILGYADYENHKAHHELLIKQVRQLRTKLEIEGHSISFELLHFLKKWLTKHIMEEDMEYVPHFLKNGAKRSFNQSSWLNRFWGSLHK